MSDRKLLPGKFVWFEHVSHNTKKAQAKRSRFDSSRALLLFHLHQPIQSLGERAKGLNFWPTF